MTEQPEPQPPPGAGLLAIVGAWYEFDRQETMREVEALVDAEATLTAHTATAYWQRRIELERRIAWQAAVTDAVADGRMADATGLVAEEGERSDETGRAIRLKLVAAACGGLARLTARRTFN